MTLQYLACLALGLALTAICVLLELEHRTNLRRDAAIWRQKLLPEVRRALARLRAEAAERRHG